jgi:hypothetical protein
VTETTDPDVLALIDLAREGRHAEIMGMTGATGVTRSTQAQGPHEDLSLFGQDAYHWLAARGGVSRTRVSAERGAYPVARLVLGAWDIHAYCESVGGDSDPGDDDCEGTDADDSTYFAAVEAGHPSLFPLEQE